MARFSARRFATARSDPDAERAGPPPRRAHRQHRPSVRQLDRRALERAGWRTTLEFRENHLRSDEGRLVDVETVWVAEAERPISDGGSVEVVTATARSESRAWARLLAAAAALDRQAVPGPDGSVIPSR